MERVCRAMKVWIVLEQSDNDSAIFEVFAFEQEAKDYAKRLNDEKVSPYVSYCVEDWDVRQ